MEVPPKANSVSHLVSSVAPFGFGNTRPASRGTPQTAPRLTLDDELLPTKMGNGGVPNQVAAAKDVDSCRAVMLKDATDSIAEDAVGLPHWGAAGKSARTGATPPLISRSLS